MGSNPASDHSAAMRAGGSSRGSSVSLKVPQCIATKCAAFSARKAFSASSGFMCCGSMNHRGSYAPMGIIAQSMGPQRAPISAKPSKYPVSPV